MKASSVAVVLVGFALSACHHDDKTSETHLTSATQDTTPRRTDDIPPPVPADEARDAGAGVVSFEADDIVVTKADRDRAKAIEAAAEGKRYPPLPKRTLRPGDPGYTGGVAPGHIMWPPGNQTGTGAPNSDGSHNMGGH